MANKSEKSDKNDKAKSAKAAPKKAAPAAKPEAKAPKAKPAAAKPEAKPVSLPAPRTEPTTKPKKKSGHGHGKGSTQASPTLLLVGGLALLGVGWVGGGDFLDHFTVFLLACFIGYQVVWNVSPALHTPLMSVTNAISGIIIIGGMLQIGGSPSEPAVILGALAILVATINIAGGFLVTQRMLKMFHK